MIVTCRNNGSLPGTPSSSRPLIMPLDFQRTPEGHLKSGDHVVMERTPSGELRHWRPKEIDVADDIEYIDCGQEPCTLYKLLQNENHLIDEDIHDAPVAESLDKDCSSEVESDEDFNPEELRELLQQSDPEEDGEPMEDFTWSDDFATFAGVREDFQEHPGAKIEGTSPLSLFTQLWDEDLMESIVVETNRYAWEYIAKTHEQEGGLPPRSRVHDWVETSVSELYRLISVIILMGMCVRGRVDEYWTTGVLGMPEFRRQMAKNRYLLLIKLLHFVDNRIIDSDGPHRKLAKIKPVLDHLNQKFKAAYTPRQELSVDESLLLRKGNLSWVQCIHTKAARFGIKSYQLCEAVSGYVLNTIIYTGADRDSMQALFGSRTTATAKVVLNLVKDYLEKGYTIFMDNYYNSVWLCRFLKSHHTDVVGTLNRHGKDTPADIKNLYEKKVNRGTMVSRHCGDVSVVSWKEIGLVTAVSTYHNADVQGQRSGTEYKKPAVIHDYYKFMGGVDLKDQKLSMYLLERKRVTKWYIKVFRHLLNISILNAYIIYTSNMTGQRKKILTHRQFRYNLAEELAQKFGEDAQSRLRSGHPSARLNRDLDHFPEHIMVSGERTAKQVRYKRSRCVRCAALNRETKANIFCSQCKVCLCVGQCWKDFHTEVNL